MNNKLDAILKELKSYKCRSTVTNPRSEANETEDIQQSASKSKKSIGVNASNTENSESENDNYPLKASEMKNLRRPAKLFVRSETDLNATLVSNEDSEEGDYHMDMVQIGGTKD